MPKATDKTFCDKLTAMWKGKSSKFEVPRFAAGMDLRISCLTILLGFILHHYASQVEYSTTGWLDKNKVIIGGLQLWSR